MSGEWLAADAESAAIAAAMRRVADAQSALVDLVVSGARTIAERQQQLADLLTGRAIVADAERVSNRLGLAEALTQAMRRAGAHAAADDAVLLTELVNAVEEWAQAAPEFAGPNAVRPS